MYTPALTAIIPRQGGPAVSIVYSSLPSSIAAMSVWRTSGGRRFPVRGAVRARVNGGGGFLDPEVPFGVPSTYRAEMFDIEGNSLGYTDPATTQLDSSISWIHNPLNPAGAIPVRLATKTGEQIAGANTVAVYYPVGRAAGIAITGQRRGIPAVPLAVWADDAATSAAIDAMFGSPKGDLDLPPFLCVRLASQFTVPLPRPLFVAVPSPTRTPVNAAAGGSKVGWDISGAEVDPPTPALAAALLSRADLDAYYPTRAARDAAYPSRLAMDTDYNLAGYAGAPAPDPIPLPPFSVADNGDGGGTAPVDPPFVDNGDGGATYS